MYRITNPIRFRAANVGRVATCHTFMTLRVGNRSLWLDQIQAGSGKLHSTAVKSRQQKVLATDMFLEKSEGSFIAAYIRDCKGVNRDESWSAQY